MSNLTKVKIIDKIYRALNKDGYGGVIAANVCSQLQYLPDKNNYKRGYRLELIKKGILIDENREV